MKSGNLVRIKKAGIGVPADSVGLVVTCSSYNHSYGFVICEVQLCRPDNRIVRRLSVDLEAISASR